MGYENTVKSHCFGIGPGIFLDSGFVIYSYLSWKLKSAALLNLSGISGVTSEAVRKDGSVLKVIFSKTF